MRTVYPCVGKRLFDLIVALPIIIILLPAFGLLAMLLRTLQGSPILFCQQRPGLHGRPFTFYKLRTMTDGRNAQGDPLPDEQRLTRIGRFLRNASLDELFELWNVLKGDMSIVGPRPLLMEYLDRYSSEQARRHEVKPGISGWAQVNGRNTLTWEGKFELDIWYVDNMSFRLDVKILALTLWKVIKREGINQPGQATMSEFMGTKN